MILPSEMNRPRILIVDDERLIRWSLQQKLSSSGYAARDAGTGEDALRMLEEERPDLVLLDVRLPGIDGIEVLRRVRRADPSIVVVMLSAGDAVEHAIRCREEGAFDYVVKPFELTAVLTLVERALEAGRERRRHEAEGPERVAAVDRVRGSSAAIRKAVELLRAAAAEEGPVLLAGEPGSGKDLFARTLHEFGAGADRPFLRVHCGALPDHLCEYELFGHERGGFPPEEGPRPGLIEQASGGTLFLEEVSELKAPLQEKLRDLLTERAFRRLGGTESIPADVRFVVGTTKDLAKGVAAGWFRADLAEILSRRVIRIPTLEERREDIPVLAEHFLRRFGARYGRGEVSLTPAALASLLARSWPGNVRELRGVLERAVLDATGEAIDVEGLSGDAGARARRGPRPAGPEKAEARWAL